MSTDATSAPSAPSSTPVTSSAPSTSSTPSTSSATNTTQSAPQSSGAGGGDPGAKSLSQQPEDAQTQAAAKEEARKLKLKVNGRELEFDEQEVVRRAQLSSAADEKFREAAEMRKQAEQFFQTLINDPKSILMHPEIRDRINFRALAEEYLGGELQRELMSPEERELQELREFKRQQDETRQRTEQETLTRAQQQEMAQLQQRAAAEYDVKITEVLAKTNLPKNAYTVKRVAEMLHGALSKGYDLDIPTAVDMVREGYLTDIQALVGGLDGDALLGVLGDDLTKKIRKHDLARLKAQIQPQQVADAQPFAEPTAARSKEGEQKYLRPDEWKEMLRRKAGV